MSLKLGRPPVGVSSDEEIHQEYSEKIWGKDVGSEHVIDGNVFRGKRVFNKAKEGLKDVMKKAVGHEIGSIKFKALDTRIKGAGLEIDVEIIENKNRGVGILKLYGPNSKKEYTVTVSKSKNSDSKHVIMLAEKVIKPLMKKFIDDQVSTGDLKNENDIAIEEKIPVFQCEFCEKTSISPAGLKGHVTKMHNKKRKAFEDVKDVVENILKEVVEISDDEELEEVTLEESVSKKDSKTVKKYVNTCDYCGLEITASIKYA